MQLPETYTILAMHDQIIAEIGGMSGIRDLGLLESAIARPHNMIAYEDVDVIQAASVLATAIAHNHAFLDGNKRTALAALHVALAMNGYEFAPPVEEQVEAMVHLADHSMPEQVFEEWVRDHSQFNPALAMLAGLDAGDVELPRTQSLQDRMTEWLERQDDEASADFSP